MMLPKLHLANVALMVALVCGQLAAAEPSTPNLIFILADDLGYGDLGCYGAPDIRTPRLDALAAQGMHFTEAYANGPTCSPTRYAFITGRYQQRGGLEYALYYQENNAGLPADGETLPRLLRSAGWRTALIGKWHLGYDAKRAPNAQGFQHFFGLLGGNHHYFQHMDRLGHHDLFLNAEPVKRQGYSTDLFTHDAIRLLREPREQPLFLFLSHPAPHFPYQGPGDAGRKVEPRKKSWQDGTRANYVSMVEHLDQSVGRLLDELDRLDLAKSTLVVFTSDNGGDSMGRNLPLSGRKGTLGEGGIRVPCIARWPGIIPAGKTSATPIITMDWTATFLALAGVTRREAADGVNLLPLLRGQDDALRPRDLFWRRVPEPVRGRVVPQRAVRHGAWKYLEEQGQPPRLFDLSQDPAETRDLSSRHPAICTQLRAKIEAWEASMPVTNPPFASFLSPVSKP